MEKPEFPGFPTGSRKDCSSKPPKATAPATHSTTLPRRVKHSSPLQFANLFSQQSETGLRPKPAEVHSLVLGCEWMNANLKCFPCRLLEFVARKDELCIRRSPRQQHCFLPRFAQPGQMTLLRHKPQRESTNFAYITRRQENCPICWRASAITQSSCLISME